MTKITKATLHKYDTATRNHAQAYNNYDVLDCTACMPFGGSGTHELVRRNPNAKYILLDWQVEDINRVLDYMSEHDPITTNITIEVKASKEIEDVDTYLINAGYDPDELVSRMRERMRKAMDKAKGKANNDN